MIVSELLELLQGHDPNAEVKIATNRANPYMSSVRGVVSTGGSYLFICQDYDSTAMESDPWQELDGPYPYEQKGEWYDIIRNSKNGP